MAQSFPTVEQSLRKYIQKRVNAKKEENECRFATEYPAISKQLDAQLYDAYSKGEYPIVLTKVYHELDLTEIRKYMAEAHGMIVLAYSRCTVANKRAKTICGQTVNLKAEERWRSFSVEGFQFSTLFEKSANTVYAYPNTSTEIEHKYFHTELGLMTRLLNRKVPADKLGRSASDHTVLPAYGDDDDDLDEPLAKRVQHEE
jgi:hypothetical protein